MQIKATSVKNLESNKPLLYALTKSAGSTVQSVPDGCYEVKAWCLYTDVREDNRGNMIESEVLSIIISDGSKMSTISDTFKRSFADIVECMGDNSFSINVFHGKSKNGREYCDCGMNLSGLL